MRLFRFIFIVIIFLTTLGLFYWAAFAPKEDISARIHKSIEEQAKRADLAFKKVSFEESNGAEKFWQLDAETAGVNKSTGLATLQNTNGTFYKNGRPVLKFRSPAALWDMTKKEIYLDKPLGYDVNAERQIAERLKTLKHESASIFNLPAVYKKGLGYWFQAKNLSWKFADQELVCTGGIVLNKGEITGYADRLRGDVEFKKVFLDGSPRVVIQSPNYPVTLEAEQFEISSLEDRFTAHGQPAISWGQALINAQEAGYYQTEKKVKLSGDVTINYKDIKAFGSLADYFVFKQYVILSGQARAEQGESRLSSDKVMVSLKNRKISLLGKSRVVIPAGELQP